MEEESDEARGFVEQEKQRASEASRGK